MKYKKYNFKTGDKVSKDYTYLEEDLTKSTSDHRYIKVKCTCGSICTVRMDSSTLTRSCKKCGQLKRRSTFTEKTKESLFKRLYHQYKKAAITRKYSFEISFEDFKKLVIENCYYCNEPPANLLKQNHRSIEYNGLDRVDNTIGYAVSNVVTCCGWCNQMKNKYSTELFLNKIKTIYKNRIKNG